MDMLTSVCKHRAWVMSPSLALPTSSTFSATSSGMSAQNNGTLPFKEMS